MIEALSLDRRSALPVAAATATVLLSAALGAAAAARPPMALLGGAVFLAACLVLLGRHLPGVFLSMLAIWLAAYMFLGKGFAYAGVRPLADLPPLFVSEILLAVALLSLLYTTSARKVSLLHVLLFAFMAWGFLQTVPYIKRDGIYAFRDAIIWGYGIFAFAVSFAFAPGLLEKVARRYAVLLPFFLVWLVALGAADSLLSFQFPSWPQSNVPIAFFKRPDMAVHLAGLVAFVILGLNTYRTRGVKLPELALWALVAIAFGFVSLSRGALASVALAALAACALWPSRRLLPFIGGLAIMGAVAFLLLPSVAIQGSERQLGTQQITRNFVSIVSGGGDASLQGTKKWRQQWWDKIWNYTVHGRYFWTGKGFGVNLADEDGFQTDAQHSLRSPHSGHVTILARMGVPGLALWIPLQAGFGLSLLLAFLRARRAGAVFWAQMDAWILVYWLAMMVNMSFDVYLEGPQGGIWFWSIFGLGLAALGAQRQPMELHARGTFDTDVEPLAGGRTS